MSFEEVLRVLEVARQAYRAAPEQGQAEVVRENSTYV